MGLALAAVRLQPPNFAHDLTTMPTHKAGAEIAPFVCIDESAVSASQAGFLKATTPLEHDAMNTRQGCLRLLCLPLLAPRFALA